METYRNTETFDSVSSFTQILGTKLL